MTHYQQWTFLKGFDVDMTLDRHSFLVGDTVTIRIRISELETRIPLDTTVEVDLFRLQGAEDPEEPLVDPVIESPAVGDHVITFQTAGLEPGVYEIGVRSVLAGGDESEEDEIVVLQRDLLVLKAAS